MASTKRDEAMAALISTSEAPVPWCDEFIKMISGMHFSVGNSEIMMDMKAAIGERLGLFNDIGDDAVRLELAGDLFGRVGLNPTLEQGLDVAWGCNTFIGNDVVIDRNVKIWDYAPVQIGSGTILFDGVTLRTAVKDDGDDDDNNNGERDSETFYAKPITIGEDCWIGARATILAGVTIGQGATVAEGSVVKEDVAAEALVSGDPAQPVVDFGDGDGPGREVVSTGSRPAMYGVSGVGGAVAPDTVQRLASWVTRRNDPRVHRDGRP